MTVSLAQTSDRAHEGWWNWAVWIDGDAQMIEEVESVTYHLHPTFREPVRTVTDRRRSFQLDARGWGEFMIRATVRFRDGSTKELSHWLELDDDGVDRRDRDERHNRVYVSHAAVDSPVADAVKAALVADGFEVLSETGTIPAGSSISSHLTDLIESADRMVVVVSDSTGPWVESEMKLAEKLHIPISVVGVGGHLPDWAEPSVVLKPELEADDIAAALQSRI